MKNVEIQDKNPNRCFTETYWTDNEDWGLIAQLTSQGFITAARVLKTIKQNAPVVTAVTCLRNTAHLWMLTIRFSSKKI